MKYVIPAQRKIMDRTTKEFVLTNFTISIDTDKINIAAFIRAATNKQKKSKALSGAIIIQAEKDK